MRIERLPRRFGLAQRTLRTPGRICRGGMGEPCRIGNEAAINAASATGKRLQRRSVRKVRGKD